MQIDAIVLLPDHLHTIWTLPRSDTNYSTRWAWIKKEFTKAWLQAGGMEQQQTLGRERDRRRGIWQPKFWEHTIADERDFERHIDYIHYNPVKHGLVSRPRDWPWSSFHRCVRRNLYPLDWGCANVLRGDMFDDMGIPLVNEMAGTAGPTRSTIKCKAPPCRDWRPSRLSN